MQRIFIALLINNELKNGLIQIQEKLKVSKAEVKWVSHEGIHLTLKFLGNVEDFQMENIYAIVSAVVANFSPFTISLSSLNAFPGMSRPQIIWVGIQQGREVICEINQQIEDNLVSLGFEKEKKRFSPHLTIGRVKGNKRCAELTSLLPKIESSNIGQMRVEAIHIMKSQLTSQGAIYSVLKEISLKGCKKH